MSEDMDSLAGKSVVIVGLARQGEALARYLAGVGARVTVTDRRSEAELRDRIGRLSGLPIRYVLGGHPVSLLDGADLLCLSGGVPLDIPLVVEARRRGIPLSNDAQIFIERCPAPVVGITGSAGKTTTTTLVGLMAEATGRPTHVGGNIGHVLIGELDQIGAGDHVIMELSSFQLEIMDARIAVAAVLNITPNHLDRHGTMEAYTEAKARILIGQRDGDVAVLGLDDPGAAGLADRVRGRLHWFSARGPVKNGAYLDGDRLILALDGRERLLCRRDEILLRGDHNVLNVLAAGAIAQAAGIEIEAMREAIRGFTGVEHRLEVVAEVNGVQYVNDSIATAPERVVAALRSFDEPIVLLAGGRDKKLPWDEMAKLTVERVRYLLCFGEAGPMIADVVGRAQAMAPDGMLEGIEKFDDMESAVIRAAEVAHPGEVVLLSPGGTSFDAYRDFAERGEHFRRLVIALAEV